MASRNTRRFSIDRLLASPRLLPAFLPAVDLLFAVVRRRHPDCLIRTLHAMHAAKDLFVDFVRTMTMSFDSAREDTFPGN
ncbi:hypothetical protein [Paraburkholderia sp. J69-2]|uniref:hypothetical protein n=1 Tax=Paraburkholderia sp. J69-2 TaxID=2805437 RepID=UPI002AB30583|nr:hypothetical protein [Paraburkholderia sp. J69-2]